MKEDTAIVKSVLKALAALDFVLEKSMVSRGAGLGEIAAGLDLQPTNTRNILKTMEQAGYIGRTPDRLYIPGPKCEAMNRTLLVGKQLISEIMPVLDALMAEFGESFVVTTLFGGRRKVLMSRKGTSPIVVETQNAERDCMIYQLVTTRIMLAFAPVHEKEAFLAANDLPSASDWAEADTPAKLEHCLANLREAGYAEHYPGKGAIYAAAFPIIDSEGKSAGALGIYLPAFRMTPDLHKQILESIRQKLSQLQKQL